MNNIPNITPRRPLDDDEPEGYLESDKDYVLNNIEAAVALLDWAEKANVFLVMNSDGLPVQAASTLGNASDWARANNYRFDFRTLDHIVELEIDGKPWGQAHNFEEDQ